MLTMLRPTPGIPQRLPLMLLLLMRTLVRLLLPLRQHD
jgi:hypothetical protein